jgi:hypothetical protein
VGGRLKRVQRDIYICDRPIRHVNFFFSQRSHHISAAVVNAQGHSRSPAAVSGQVAYRCAVYSLIILYVKREAVIVLMKLSVGILMLLLSCVYIQYDVASRRAFFTEKKSFLLKAKRFRTVPFSLFCTLHGFTELIRHTDCCCCYWTALFSSLSLVTRCWSLSNRLHVTFPESLKWPLSIPAVICTYTRPPQLENDPVIKCTALLLLRLPTLNVIYSIHVYTADCPY